MADPKHLVVLGATRRGYLFIQKLLELAPQHKLTVFSFPEDPWEPPFLEDIRRLTEAGGGTFHVAKQVGAAKWAEFWQDNPIDLMFAVSWRYLVPPRIYQQVRLGTFVFHDSLLPSYRGFAPTVWAILNGETQTGVTLFEIAEGVDEGLVVAQAPVPIGPDEPIAVVMERVTEAYLQLLVQNLASLLDQTAPRWVQDEAQATYTVKRLPEDNCINWQAPTRQIFDLIRAVSRPYPGAFTYLSGERLRVWSAAYLPAGKRYIGRVPGRVAEILPGEGCVVLTGDGALLVKDVQREDGEVICAADLLHSLALTLGS